MPKLRRNADRRVPGFYTVHIADGDHVASAPDNFKTKRSITSALCLLIPLPRRIPSPLGVHYLNLR